MDVTFGALHEPRFRVQSSHLSSSIDSYRNTMNNWIAFLAAALSTNSSLSKHSKVQVVCCACDCVKHVILYGVWSLSNQFTDAYLSWWRRFALRSKLFDFAEWKIDKANRFGWWLFVKPPKWYLAHCKHIHTHSLALSLSHSLFAFWSTIQSNAFAYKWVYWNQKAETTKNEFEKNRIVICHLRFGNGRYCTISREWNGDWLFFMEKCRFRDGTIW